MPDNLENALFFPGGRILFPATIGAHSGLKLINNEDGSWTIRFEALIVAEEAKDMIRRFTDFDAPPEGADFGKTYQNQIFFEAFANAGDKETKDIKCKSVELNILTPHKSEASGQIILRMIPTININKTENAAFKTENAGTGTGN